MKVEKAEIKKLGAKERRDIILEAMKEGAPLDDIWNQVKEHFKPLFPTDIEKQKDRFNRDFEVLKNERKIRQVGGNIWIPEKVKVKREPPKYVKVKVKLKGTMPYLGGYNYEMAWWTTDNLIKKAGLEEKSQYLVIERNQKDTMLARAGQLRGCLRDTAQTIGMSGLSFVNRIYIQGPMVLKGDLAPKPLPVNVATFAGGKPISSVGFHEALFPGWEVETIIEFPTRDISVEDFKTLLERAGNKGLGAAHSLGYGTFEVSEYKVLEYLSVAENLKESNEK
jgi:hypothetical protein